MRGLGGLAVWIAGLMFVFEALRHLVGVALTIPGLAISFGDPYVWLSIATGIALVAAAASVGAYLTRNAGRLADRFIDDEPLPSGVSETGLLRVGLILVGLALVVVSASGLVGTAVSMLTAEVMRRSMSLDEVGSVLQVSGGAGDLTWGLIQLFAGLYLVRSSSRLAERLRSGRETRSTPATEAACPTCGSPYDPADYRDMSTARCSNCGGRLGE